MKRRILLSSFVFIFLVTIICRTNAQEYLIPNQTKTYISPWGKFFDETLDERDDGFIVPYKAGKENPHSIAFALSVLTGRVNNQVEAIFRYEPGPIDTVCSNRRCPLRFDKNWVVEGGHIQKLKDDIADNGVVDSVLDNTILEWPGRGNPYFRSLVGYSLPDSVSAPFYDFNEDNIYNPYDGDYPIIGEDFADVVPNSLSWVLCHEPTLKLEVQILSWGFRCEDDTTQNQTLYTRTITTNKSDSIIKDAFYGFQIDYDLGCFEDDLIGSIPDKNACFTYNHLTHRDTLCRANDGSLLVDYEKPTTMTTVMLNQKMSSMVSPLLGQPNIPSHFYNLMQGRWRDGTPLTKGGTGYNENSTDTVKFHFPGLVTDPNSWNMAGLEYQSRDVRCFMSSDIGDFLPEQTITFDVVWTLHQNETKNAYTVTDHLPSIIDNIQSFYDNGFQTGCQQLIEPICNDNCVWPGDADNNGFVRGEDLLLSNYGKHFNQGGSKRQFISGKWSAFHANEWDGSLGSGSNEKHADCDGSGDIDDDDMFVTMHNLFKRNMLAEIPLEQSQIGEEGISFGPDVTQRLRLASQSLIWLNYHEFNAELSPSFQDSLHGISFSIRLNPYCANLTHDRFRAFNQIPGLESFPDTILYEFQKFNDKSHDDMSVFRYIDFPNKLLTFVVMSKSNKPINKLDNLVKYTTTLNHHVYDLLQMQDTIFFPIELINIYGINMNGEYVTVPYSGTTWNLSEDFSTSKNIELSESLNLFPNPASSELFFQSDVLLQQIQLIDITGKVVYDQKEESKTGRISLVDFSSGLYLFKGTTESGDFICKKVFVRK